MLKLKTPIEHEGETYDLALVYLSCAPVIRGNDYTTAVNLQVIPGRQTEDAIIQLPARAIPIVLSADVKGGGLTSDLVVGYGQVEIIIHGALRAFNVIE